MTRDDYFTHCIKAALHLGEHLRFCDVDWRNDELVLHRGKKYVPKTLQIGFDRNGRSLYTAVLQDVKANYSIVNAKLCDVEEYRNGKSTNEQ